MLLADNAEPTSAEQVAAWVSLANRSHDPLADVYAESEAHRAAHGAACDVYPSSNGRLLAVLAAAVRAKRVLEIGCGLGYGALCLAEGGGPETKVDTIEIDPEHAALARRNIERHAAPDRIAVHVGRAIDVLPALIASYDLIFVDSDLEDYPAQFERMVELLADGGLLVSSNLFLGVYAPEYPWLARGAEYRTLLLEDRRLETSFMPGGLALSYRRNRA